jgi:large subunit ribosomal protein L11
MPILKMLVEGGNMKPGPTVAQQLGPMGLNMGKIIADINTATKDFKGMNVPINLDVNAKTKTYTIAVLTPPTSELIKKELGIEMGSGDRKKTIVGNLAIEQVIAVTKTKYSGSLAKDFLSAFKSVIGSCLSMGTLIESKDPKEFLEEIKQGKFKKELQEQKTEVSPEKKKELASYFSSVKAKQEEAKKKEEEAKAAEEAAKVAAAAAAGTTPAAGAAVTAATPTAASSAEKTSTAAAKPAAKK